MIFLFRIKSSSVFFLSVSSYNQFLKPSRVMLGTRFVTSWRQGRFKGSRPRRRNVCFRILKTRTISQCYLIYTILMVTGVNQKYHFFSLEQYILLTVRPYVSSWKRWTMEAIARHRTFSILFFKYFYNTSMIILTRSIKISVS